MADFRFSAALDIFFLPFSWSWGGGFLVFDVFRLFGSGFIRSVSSWFAFLGLGWSCFLKFFFAYFVLPTPPLSVGADRNRSTHLWHRTRFQTRGLGLGGSWRIP